MPGGGFRSILGHLHSVAPALGHDDDAQWGELSSPHGVIHPGEKSVSRGKCGFG